MNAEERRSNRVLSAFILLAFALAGIAFTQEKPARRPWRIKGQFTEACTCSAPCACNFGERPSPYDYCYTMWSYWVQEGSWEQVKLKYVRIGGVDGTVGILCLIDVRAEHRTIESME